MRTRVGPEPPALADRGPFQHSARKSREGERVEILHAAGEAFLIIFTWHTLPFLFLGVTMGLCLGILPGIGGGGGTPPPLPFPHAMGAPPPRALPLRLGATP